MDKDSAIFIAGHKGLVGGAVLRRLQKGGYNNLITRTHGELDLTDQQAVNDFFNEERPEYVFLAAAKVGGIGANSSHPAPFIYQNTMIGFNVVHAAYKSGVKKLLNLGSSCIYPKLAPQPIKEEYLLTGSLETTNDAYAIAKIAVIKLCAKYNLEYGTNFISVMPTNLYGPGDNYNLESSHVLPAMIRKFHEAKIKASGAVTLWGDGSPFREFLYGDDLADAAVYLMENRGADEIGEFINVGTGKDLTIRELAKIVKDAVYEDAPESNKICQINWDASKPNGTPKKLLDVSRLNALGWSAKTELKDGVRAAYADFLERYEGGKDARL